MFQVFYKNYAGKWVSDKKTKSDKVGNDRLAWVKKNKALNGQATLQVVG